MLDMIKAMQDPDFLKEMQEMPARILAAMQRIEDKIDFHNAVMEVGSGAHYHPGWRETYPHLVETPVNDEAVNPVSEKGTLLCPECGNDILHAPNCSRA